MSKVKPAEARGDIAYAEHLADEAIADCLRFGRATAKKLLREALLRHGFVGVIVDTGRGAND